MHLADNINIPSGLVGGLIIGASASSFLYVTGQLTGLSGITEGLMKGEDWNWSYMAGLCSSGYFLSLWMPEAFGSSATTLSSLTLVSAGVLTGLGTRLGSGCTSGHGLCGLARRSPRSLTAVLTFMATGGVTAYISRHPLIRDYLQTPLDPEVVKLFDYSLEVIIPTAIVVGTGILVYRNSASMKSMWLGASASEKKQKQNSDKSSRSSPKMHLASFIFGFLFGTGLGISGMCSTDRVLRFLDFAGTEGWDPTLMSVLGGGVAVTFSNFHLLHMNETEILLECAPGDETCVSQKLEMGATKANMKIDWKLLLGSALFGIGWGMVGMCPGPAIVSLGATVVAAGKFVPSMMAGMILKELVVP